MINRLDRNPINTRGNSRLTNEEGITPINSIEKVISMERITNAMKATLEENSNLAKYQEVNNAAGYKMSWSTCAPWMIWSASGENAAINRWNKGGYRCGLPGGMAPASGGITSGFH